MSKARHREALEYVLFLNAHNDYVYTWGACEWSAKALGVGLVAPFGEVCYSLLCSSDRLLSWPT